jgi:hypothetical protein
LAQARSSRRDGPRTRLAQAYRLGGSNLVGLSEPTVEQLARVPSGKRMRIERKLMEKAQALLGGEQVLGIFRGQTSVSPVWVPLIGPLFFMVKPRAVIVTERSVITVQQSRFSQSTVVGVVSRHQCGSVSVEVSRWGLRIDGDEKVFGSLSTLEDMREVARIASGEAASSSPSLA